MITILSMLVVILAFSIGVSLGQKLNRNETIKTPKIEKEKIPFTEAHKEIKKIAKQIEEQDKELETLSRIAQNIEVYDGSSRGQRSVEE